jgi:hypothetical protein
MNLKANCVDPEKGINGGKSQMHWFRFKEKIKILQTFNRLQVKQFLVFDVA